MRFVAITSCATGIAHSYMAAEAITKMAKKNGIQVRVEIQGAMGIEDELSKDEIEKADFIVFANDVGISRSDRFSKYQSKIIQSGPHEVIKNPNVILEKAKKLLEGSDTAEKS